MTPTLHRLGRQFANVAAVLLLAFATLASAQTDDLPDRVGRVADLSGSVYVSTEERADEWVEALRNYSVTSGDNLWVADDGRAEIDYGGGQFRLAGNTNVHVARLDDRILALFVAHGRVIVRVRVLETGEAARIDTPNTQLALTRPGLYRIEVSEDRNRTTIVVREGEATVSVAAGLQQVLPGQTASVAGAEPAHAEVRSGYGLDGFDTWSADRDRRYERSRTASFVSRQMIGYADLDDHGRWDSSPEYGMIWYPTTVEAGWAPYRYGRWSWVGAYGWTWVDDAPWGYAPFHYGRWVHVGNRWGWCPGGYVARPAWAPALVGWYGGSRWAASASYGSPVYGWVPLGWGEPYIPSWHNCSGRCWTRYNRPYAVNVADALCELVCAGRRDGGSGGDVHRPPAGSSQRRGGPPANDRECASAGAGAAAGQADRSDDSRREARDRGAASSHPLPDQAPADRSRGFAGNLGQQRGPAARSGRRAACCPASVRPDRSDPGNACTCAVGERGARFTTERPASPCARILGGHLGRAFFANAARGPERCASCRAAFIAGQRSEPGGTAIGAAEQRIGAARRSVRDSCAATVGAPRARRAVCDVRSAAVRPCGARRTRRDVRAATVRTGREASAVRGACAGSPGFHSAGRASGRAQRARSPQTGSPQTGSAARQRRETDRSAVG
jgi:hypothetical protein